MSDVAQHLETDVSGPGRPSGPRLLADGSFGGILCAWLLAVVAILQHPNPYNFLAITYLPVALLVGAIMGTLIGGVLWLSEYLIIRTLGFLLRMLIGTAFSSLVGAILISAFQSTPDGRHLVEYFVPGAFVGFLLSVATALVAISRVNPWRLIVRGARTKAGETEGLALLSGMALRFGSMCGLLGSVFCFACVWPSLTSEDTALFVVVMLYFAASAGTAFASPRRSIALIVGLVSNASMLVIILRPADDSRFLALIALVYGVLWAAFVIGQYSVNKQINTPLPNQDHPVDCISGG
jgi:hypothetical protein